YIINLTPKGKEIAERTSHFTQEIRMPIENLHQTDKENLLLGLIGIIQHLNKTGIITIQRMCKTCSHYRSPDQGTKHFCKLLNKDLHVTELRVDCPEHEMRS